VVPHPCSQALGDGHPSHPDSATWQGLQGLLGSAGITRSEVVEGEGRLAQVHAEGGGSIEVGGQQYVGRNVVLATGSYARSLPSLDIGGRVITSDEALRLTDVPNRVVIVGGSVIGVEFASAWCSFGAEVTLVEALPTLVPLEDPCLSKQLERAFRKRGIGLHPVHRGRADRRRRHSRAGGWRCHRG